MKEHLLRRCEKVASHHVSSGKIHSSLHEHHQALADGDGEPEEHHAAIGALHKRLVTEHADHAGDWIHFGKMIERAPDVLPVGHETNRGTGGDLDGPKAFGDRDFGGARPDGVFGTIPDNASREHLQLVTRFGSPTEADLEKAKADVGPELAHIIERK